MMNNKKQKHIPILFEEVIRNIKIFNDKQNIIVDSTLGLGGHFIGISKKLNKGDIIIAFDLDKKNLSLAKERIKNELKNINFIDKYSEFNKNKLNIILINSNFGNIKIELENRKIEKITGIYYDLGLSSLHFDEAERGFSFMKQGPLDMRLDKKNYKTAKDIVNKYSFEKLKIIFKEYGESSQATKIARRIIDIRKKNKFETTYDLAKIIDGPPKEKAKIFQALRIELNKELEVIEKSINHAIDLLQKDGIIFIISFHSLEDRIVKNIFKRESKDCICKDLICSCKHIRKLKILTKKPIIPTKIEILNNSRSRSAKARIAQKL